MKVLRTPDERASGRLMLCVATSQLPEEEWHAGRDSRASSADERSVAEGHSANPRPSGSKYRAGARSNGDLR